MEINIFRCFPKEKEYISHLCHPLLLELDDVQAEVRSETAGVELDEAGQTLELNLEKRQYYFTYVVNKI